jgi:F-type H+-transporting ATPase subunit alpha
MRLQEILKQPQYQPTPLIDQVALILAGTRGKLDDVPVPQIKEWESGFLAHLHINCPDLEERVDAANYELTPEIEAILLNSADEYNEAWEELQETA